MTPGDGRSASLRAAFTPFGRRAQRRVARAEVTRFGGSWGM